jgi:hypothetical protein
MNPSESERIVSEPFETEIPFRGPRSLCLGPPGVLCVVDEIGHGVAAFDLEGRMLWRFDSNLPEMGPLRYPSDVAFAGDRYWVADRFRRRVLCLSREGAPLWCFPEDGDGAGALEEPLGVAAASGGRAALTDAGTRTVRILDPRGRSERVFGTPGPGSRFYRSRLFKTQEVYRKWLAAQTRFTTLESRFFSSGFYVGDLDQPRGVAAIKGRLWVADYAGSIQVFSRDGRLERSLEAPPFVRWIAPFGDSVFVSRDSSPCLYRVSPDGPPEETPALDREAGKFVFGEDGELFFCSPWERRVFRVPAGRMCRALSAVGAFGGG